MAKSQNPVDTHRRKQRQKEVKKNKEKRINERDERVKKEKTVAEVKAEIKEFETRNKKQLGQHDIKSKLDRLKKELKLVQQAEEQRKKDPSLRPKGNYAPSNNFVKLARPEMSVYYDHLYNPYGAPPPGRPMLFHRYGGGVTMNIQEAIVPGEDLPIQFNIDPAPPPPPPPPPLQSEHYPTTLQGQLGPEGGEIPSHVQHESHAVPPPPPPPMENPPPPPPPLPSEQPPPPPPRPPVISKDDIPNLPLPSESVRRTKRRQKGLTADIWASKEEVDYEKTVHQVDLEDAGASKLLEAEKDEWHYIDTAGNTQGPFPTLHMLSWQSMGYFPQTTMVKKTGKHADFVSIMTLGPHVFAPTSSDDGYKPKRKGAYKKKFKSQEEEKSALRARVAALKGTAEKPTVEAPAGDDKDDAVLARIAALRQGKLQIEDEAKVDALTGEAAVQNRIATEKNVGTYDENERQPVLEEDSVQARIAALRNGEVMEEGEQQTEREASPIHSRIASLRGEREGGNGSVEGNVTLPVQAAGEKSMLEQSLGEEGPYIAHYPAHEAESAVAPYPFDEAQSSATPSQPLDAEQEYVAPYPTDEGEVGVMAPYPVNDEYSATAAYPKDEDGDAYYPVTDEYPVTDDYPVDDAYPVGAGNPDLPPAYPMEALEVAPGAIKEPAKKKVKVDKAVVSLLPSHLQKKRLKK